MDLFALKGNILYTPQTKELRVLSNAYAVYLGLDRNGIIAKYVRGKQTDR